MKYGRDLEIVRQEAAQKIQEASEGNDEGADGEGVDGVEDERLSPKLEKMMIDQSMDDQSEPLPLINTAEVEHNCGGDGKMVNLSP